MKLVESDIDSQKENVYKWADSCLSIDRSTVHKTRLDDLVFDVQCFLGYPKLNTSVVFKRKLLYVHGFAGIFLPDDNMIIVGYRLLPVVVHEAVHAVHYAKYPADEPHGGKFAGLLMSCLIEFCNASRGELLVNANKHSVRIER